MLAFDKFKGSLTSLEVATAFGEGILELHPHCEVLRCAIADGGGGMAEALSDAMQGHWRSVVVHDPLMRPIECRYLITSDGTTAVVDMASASGLTLLSADERNPLYTTTYGTGEMVADALRQGCQRIILGIGGSATNDGGIGMLAALGYRLLNSEGRALELFRGKELHDVASIDDTQRLEGLDRVEILVASDVDNPLYGERGAATVYAPQKGADAATVELLDTALRHYATVVDGYATREISSLAGSGAAGGLGAALMGILRAKLMPGIELLLNAIDFDRRIRGCDYIFTGEGRIDHQTLMGKAPAGVLAHGRREGIPVIAIGGSVMWCDALRHSDFHSIHAATPEGMAIEEAMRHDVALDNIRHIARKIAAEL